MVHFVAGRAGKLGFTLLSMFYPVIEPAIDHGKLTDWAQCAAPIETAFREVYEAFAADFSV
jgi:hypothetical protein|tara:strand:- start:126 stop:308 length:183 start_codon:yes stop_codon:yes gene_type:complete